MTDSRPPRASALAFALLLLALGVFGTLVLTSPGARAADTTPVTGSITGAGVAALGVTVPLRINGTGGPAFAPNGTQVGNLTYYASVSAINTTGVEVVPSSSAIVHGTPAPADFTAGQTAEVVTITVELCSTYNGANVSLNITHVIDVVHPYVVSAVIVNSAATTVLTFHVQVALDGTVVGNVTVPTLTPGQQYNLSYQYATVGLSSGEHTFTISLANEHGLVTFSNGAISYSVSFYVTAPAPDYTLWYVVGAVAFFAVLFISATRVAARRRGARRK